MVCHIAEAIILDQIAGLPARCPWPSPCSPVAHILGVVYGAHRRPVRGCCAPISPLMSEEPTIYGRRDAAHDRPITHGGDFMTRTNKQQINGYSDDDRPAAEVEG